MKRVLALFSLISALQYASADCSALKTYNTELKPACSSDDVMIKWPNYANQSTYYSCLGVGKPTVTPCPSGQYFIYVMQMCGSCNNYLPAVPCEKLRTQYPPVCVAIGSNNPPGDGTNPTTNDYPTPSYPTPNYPNSTLTTPPTPSSPTGRPTRPTKPTTDGSTGTPSDIPTPPIVGPTTPAPSPGGEVTDFPGPPRPVTFNPDVPTPPTPTPTPPQVELQPPVAAPINQ